MKVLFSFFMFLVFISSSACSSRQQVLLVLVPDTQSFQGSLQRYQRTTSQAAWQPVGKRIRVVIGQKGLALHKREGDGQTPSGIFPLGPVFGFAKEAKRSFKMPYISLKDSSVCVDDPHSHFYNQLLDSASVNPDWHSAELMRQVPQYREGAVVQYNFPPSRATAGSCIFLHRWVNPQKGTAGCITMSAASLHSVLQWLDPAQKPRLAILSVKQTEINLNKDRHKPLQSPRRSQRYALPTTISLPAEID